MTTEDIQAAVKEIEERCGKATPGPWNYAQDAFGEYQRDGDIIDPAGWYVVTNVCSGTGGIDDSDLRNGPFIAHAREDIPTLIKAIHELHQYATVDRDVIQRQAKMIEELTAELTAYREQADKPEDIAELARQVARYAGAFKELAKTKQERDRYLKALEWIVEVDDNGGEECAGCYDNCERCYAEKAREALGRP